MASLINPTWPWALFPLHRHRNRGVRGGGRPPPNILAQDVIILAVWITVYISSHADIDVTPLQKILATGLPRAAVHR